MNLNGKLVVVIASSGGIDFEIARTLARDGGGSGIASDYLIF